MADLTDIITSRVRVKILKLFFSDVKEIHHVRGITREISEEINSVRRELIKLEKTGIVNKENRGNRLYYWVRDDYPYFGDILAMVAKSVGLGKEIIDNKNKIGKISFVMFSGNFVRRKEKKKDDQIDVLVVGNDVVLPELAALIRKEEQTRNTEVNYTVMGKDELLFRKRRRDPFLLSILSESRIMILGDEEDLVG